MVDIQPRFNFSDEIIILNLECLEPHPHQDDDVGINILRYQLPITDYLHHWSPGPHQDDDVGFNILGCQLPIRENPHHRSPSPHQDDDVGFNILGCQLPIRDNPHHLSPSPHLDDDVGFNILGCQLPIRDNPHHRSPGPHHRPRRQLKPFSAGQDERGTPAHSRGVTVTLTLCKKSCLHLPHIGSMLVRCQNFLAFG